MGLDMYLFKKTYVENWDHMKPEERHTITVSGPRAANINPERISYIVEEVGYWRKANAVHAWFVANVQEGVDDCREYHVSRENLHSLLEVVNKVLEGSALVPGAVTNGYTSENGMLIPNIEPGAIVADPALAELLLPPQPGFFFGSTDLDEYYIHDLQLTKDILERALAFEGGDYYYRASW